MLNKFGKTLTIFVALIVILLISSTSIGFFLYNQEMQVRKTAEGDRDIAQAEVVRLRDNVTDLKKTITVLQDKNKEADEKINSLLDEKDLNEGLRKELKKENAELKEQIESINKLNAKLKSDFEDTNSKTTQFQELLKAAEQKSKDLQKRVDELEEAKKAMSSKIGEMSSDLQPLSPKNSASQVALDMAARGKDKVELDKIIVNPQDGIKGHILSVDKEAEFIVCNLGSKQNIKSNDILSVYRGEEYLGDVRVTRVQEEMSAADLIPPFSSRKVRKNDTVVIKP